MKFKAKLTVMLVLLALVALAVWRISDARNNVNAKKQTPPSVKLASPARESIVQSLRLTGDLVAVQKADVFVRVYGNLQSIKVNIGDYVTKDQVLAEIDTVELAQQYRETAATFDNAQSQFNRAKALMDRQLTSQQDFDNAQTALKVALSNFETAKTRLQYAQVRAPFSGYITNRYFDPGAVLTSTNATLFTLADLDVMKVMVNVLERDIPKVHIGTEAIVHADAYPDRQFSGKVARQSQALDLSTRTMTVEVDIPNGDRTLKPGMFASVELVYGRRDSALTLPTQAILRDSKGGYVFIAEGDSARRRPVTTGAQLDMTTEITGGLQGSDKVIVLGQQLVKDNGPIRIQQ